MPRKSRRSRVKIDAGDRVCTYTSKGGYRCTSKLLRKGDHTCTEHIDGSDDWILLPSPSPALREVAAQPYWGMQSMGFFPTQQQQNPPAPVPTTPTPSPVQIVPNTPPSPPRSVKVFYYAQGREDAEVPEVLGGINPVVVSAPAPASNPPGSGSPAPGSGSPAPPIVPTPDPTHAEYSAPHAIGTAPRGVPPNSGTENTMSLGTDFDLLSALSDGSLKEPNNPDANFYADLKNMFDMDGNMCIGFESKFYTYNTGKHTIRHYIYPGLHLLARRMEYELQQHTLTKANVPSLTILKGVAKDGTKTHQERLVGDICYLQTDKKFEHAVFQVASNFNGLEQAHDYDAPGPIRKYPADNTQGPHAVFNTLAAILFRRYLCFDPTTSAPDNSSTFKNYPGIFVKSSVPDLYDSMETTIGGWLDPTRVQVENDLNVIVTNSLLEGAIAIAVGMGMIGVENCSSMILFDVFTGEMFLMFKKEMKIHHALCASIDTQFKQAELSDTINTWIAATVFASYYNTLRFAVEIGATKVVLTLIGGGAFGVSGQSIYEHMMAAMYLVAMERPALLHMKIFVSLYDASDRITSDFYDNVRNNTKWPVNYTEIDNFDNIPA